MVPKNTVLKCFMRSSVFYQVFCQCQGKLWTLKKRKHAKETYFNMLGYAAMNMPHAKSALGPVFSEAIWKVRISNLIRIALALMKVNAKTHPKNWKLQSKTFIRVVLNLVCTQNVALMVWTILQTLGKLKNHFEISKELNSVKRMK